MTAPRQRADGGTGRDGEDPAGLYAQVVAAFEEVALLSTSEHVPLDDVLRLVGRRLCELLGVSRCSVYLRREDGRFQGQVGYCVGRRSIDAGVSRLVSGVEHDLFTAEIVRTAAPVLVQGAITDPRTIHRTMRRWGVRDMLGVPLVVDGDAIGIIYVDNQAEEHLYTTRDVELAKTFAGLAAIAVRQAWLYQQLARRATVTDRQRRVLGASALIHSRVTRAVLDGADIPELLRLIVELLGKPVVLYDTRLAVAAWAAPQNLAPAQSPGLTRAQLALPVVRDALVRLEAGAASTMLRATPELRCRRLLVRIVVDQKCAGYLELCELGGGFGPTDAKALEQAAMAVALKLVTQARTADALRHEREDFLADLLYRRREPGRLAAEAVRFGIDAAGRHLLLRLQYAQEPHGDAVTGKRRREEVAQLIGRHLRDGQRCVAYTGVPGADLLLVEMAATEAVAAAESGWRDSLDAALPDLNGRYGVRHAVASEPCRTLSDLPVAAERIREVAALAASAAGGGDGRLVFAGDFELVRVVSRRDGLGGARGYAEELLAPLVEHDVASGGCLVETLRAFVACQAHIRPAAALLEVHENTVRYRLNRIRELSGIDPERLEDLLRVCLAFQVLGLFTGEAGLSSSPTGGEEPVSSRGRPPQDEGRHQGAHDTGAAA
ncbi:GAF domain-containing protein [Dactylosporangium sp. NPDC048998]|uniref:helix-turn-helix domain-containing protein n=1 Tax=Dactylosporangium sp. NPDC048998 TaxID=3363976 RepID=UPI003716C44E